MDEDYPLLPQFLKFKSSQGPCSASCEWNADTQCLEITDLSEESPGQMVQPNRLRWKAFWLLLDLAGVWHWQRTYAPDDVLSCDGHQWSIEISRDGRYVNTCGSEAYPGTAERDYREGSPFDILSTAIKVLLSRDSLHGLGLDEERSTEPVPFDFHEWSDAFEDMGTQLTWDRQSQALRWKPVSNRYPEWHPLPPPSPQTWKAFRLLLDHAKIHSWEARYTSVTTAHVGWGFEAQVGDRNISTAGGDTYPNSEEGHTGFLPGSPYDILLTGLGLLAGKEIQDLRTRA